VNGLAVVLLLGFGLASAQCPAFVHKVATKQYVDSGAVIPKGTVVCGLLNANGLFTAPLGQNTAALIPNSDKDGMCNSTQITEDGQWVLYNAGGPKIIRIDGQFKTAVPGTTSKSEGCCTFWWHAPSGKLEVVYRAPGDATIHAIPVTFGAAEPTFGTDHIIANLTGGAAEFTMGVSYNHIFTRFDDAHMGPKMITIPNNGAGTATNADFYKPTEYPYWGCRCTISHDGYICVYNPGFDQWCHCMLDEGCLTRYKSCVLLPFQEVTATPVSWPNTLVKTMAISINWAPANFLLLNPNDTGGHGLDTNSQGSQVAGWCFTNDSTYLSCEAWGHKIGSDSGCIFLVHWPTNTWTRILTPIKPVSRATLLAFSSVWIDTSDNNGVIWLPGIPKGHRSELIKGNSSMVDIRGRIVPNAKTARNLVPGIYYFMNPDGVMRRVVVKQ
jgi:hypothetical protein